MAIAKPRVVNRRIVGIMKAARYAGVSRWTLRAWILEGRLPFLRYPAKGGGEERTMVDLDDLDAFIDRAKDHVG
jgi:excisionase family DNA binding protein